MLRLLKNYSTILVYITSVLFGLSGCNQTSNAIGGNGVNQASAYFGGKRLSQESAPSLNVKWMLDGDNLNSDLPPSNAPSLADMGWHILTLEVVNQNTPLATPIPLGGIQAQFYPKPMDNKGESIELVDINCHNAQFSKNGDTCSVYMRVFYDYERVGVKNPPLMYVQFAPVNYESLPLLFALNVKPLIDRSQGEYREVLPIENVGGDIVKANRQQYIILQMQNIALQPLAITTISNLTNPKINLMHRANSADNDAYYGDRSECSLTANTALNQVNRLESFNDSCILIYQTPMSATREVESDIVNLATDAYMTSPWTLNSNAFLLIASYFQGQPIPTTIKDGAEFSVASGHAHAAGNAMVMDTDGSLDSGVINPSPNPFNLVDITYKYLSSNKLVVADNVLPYLSSKVLNIAESCQQSTDPIIPQEICTSPVKTGSQIVTLYSTTNPVTVGQVLEKVPAASSSESKFVSVDSCGGGRTNGHIWLTADLNSTKAGFIHLHADAGAPIHCGVWDSRNLDVFVPLNGVKYQNTFFSGDDSGCGGNQWDIGGNATVSGSCDDTNCIYRLDIQSHHGGVDGQCKSTTYNNVIISVPKPKVYQELSNLQNFNYSGRITRTVGMLANENLTASFGGQGEVLA